MIKKLQRKFIFSAMLAISILLIFLLGAINIANARSSSIQSKQMLDSLLNSEIMLHPPRNENAGFLSAPMDENAKISAVYFMVRTDNADNIVSIDVSSIATVSEEDATDLFHAVSGKHSTEGKIKNFRYKVGTDERGSGKVYLFLNTAMQTHTVLRVLILSVLIGLVCWAAMLLLVILLSKKAIRPVAENIEHQKQFVTDAGHEIKTPLAIILSNTEAIELYTGESKWSRNIKEQVTRLNGLMQTLLTLAKAEEMNSAEQKESIPLSELTEKTVDMFAENASCKHIRIEKYIEPNIIFCGNVELLSRLLSILMDNAVKYAAEDSEISVAFYKSKKNVHLEISNVCQTLPDCPADRLFDRFYRADTSRTQKSGGYGIGLSAAKSIVSAQKGEIRAEYHENNVILFRVKL